MYTTMAAKRSGVEVSMFAPKPEPMPVELEKVSVRLNNWLGPVVLPADLPHFEIQHLDDKASYLSMTLGAEGKMLPVDLPDSLAEYDAVHLTPLGDCALQQAFLRSCRQRGAQMLSAGTYLCTIQKNPDLIRESIKLVDVFFMNEEEAILLYDSLDQVKAGAGKLIFVTLGGKGALVVQGEVQTRLTTRRIEAVDQTGAGDTFCGAVLAQLLLGSHPVMAAQKAMALSVEEISDIGPTALLKEEPASAAPLDPRVRIDYQQINCISEIVKLLDAASPSSFIGKDFPPENHPAALDYFFATIFQQFSFWESEHERYAYPLIASLDGDKLKGSAYLFRAYVRAVGRDETFFSTERQATLSDHELRSLFRADDGSDPMPAFELHLRLARDYGRDMLALDKTPHSILESAQNSSTPLKTFLHELDQIGGYKEDPLRKKSNLLALVLNQRPEKFLSFGEGEAVPPVIDYHTMRGCLRMGLVEILDEHLKGKITARQIVTPDEEWAIRYACYIAVEEVVRVSGKSLGAVDWFFFAYSRQQCPEMSEPVCESCGVNRVCLHRKELFQPVIRTTYY